MRSSAGPRMMPSTRWSPRSPLGQLLVVLWSRSLTETARWPRWRGGSGSRQWAWQNSVRSREDFLLDYLYLNWAADFHLRETPVVGDVSGDAQLLAVVGVLGSAAEAIAILTPDDDGEPGAVRVVSTDVDERGSA